VKKTRADSLLAPPLWQEPLGDAFPSYGRREGIADTVVVGGGLAGLSAAFHLLAAGPGRRVVVLERDRVGSGATARSTGMLTPGVGQNLRSLVRRVGRARAAAMYRETLRAVTYVRELTEREGIDCELRMSGQLIVARGRSGERRIDALAALLDELDLPGERLGNAALASLIRLQSSRGLRLPIAGTLHPGRLARGLAKAVVGRGGAIYERSRVESVGPGQPATVVLASGGRIVADHVVLAAGGYTPGLGFLRGRVLPLHLSVLLTEPLSRDSLASLGWHGREGVIDSRRIFDYFRLTEDDRVLFGGGLPRYLWGGATDDEGRDRESDRAVRALEAEMRGIFPPDVRVAVERAWTGVIDYVVDALPVIERLRSRPAVLCASGFCGHGIALSVRSGAWIRDRIDGVSLPSELPWFRDRAPLVPTELGRSLGIPIGVRALQCLDRL
jgi:glycine/D-amino acid oxidase-like deaminating enzyme